MRFILSPWRLCLLLFLSVGCAVAFWPASWLMHLNVDKAPLQIVATDGSIWRGQAWLAFGQHGFQRSITPMVQWQTTFDPWPVVTIRHPWLSNAVSLRPDWRGMRVSSATIQIPASLLSSLDARFAAIQPSGQLILQWPTSTFAWNPMWPTERPMTLQWLHASTTLSHVAPLGSYQLRVEPETSDRLALQLSTLSGPLMLTGTGSWDMVQGLSFKGRASIDPLTNDADQSSLSAVLALMGPKQHGYTALQIP